MKMKTKMKMKMKMKMKKREPSRFLPPRHAFGRDIIFLVGVTGWKNMSHREIEKAEEEHSRKKERMKRSLRTKDDLVELPPPLRSVSTFLALDMITEIIDPSPRRFEPGPT